MPKNATGAPELPGNSIGSHAAYVRVLVRQAETLLDLEGVADALFEEDVIIKGVTVRFPEDDRPEYLAVVRVIWHGEQQVAFHSAPTFSEVVVGVINRLKNRSMRFKEDEYAKRDE